MISSASSNSLLRNMNVIKTVMFVKDLEMELQKTR